MAADRSPSANSSAPLTDRMLERIESRLRWYGSKSAAARYAGISRQNLGKLFREKGIGRDSEILLRLDAFSRMSETMQRKLAGKEGGAVPMEEPHDSTVQRSPNENPEIPSSSENQSLPDWLL